MRKRVLIIENDKKILDILAFALGREGYLVNKASSLVDALLDGENMPDLVILDMPSVQSEAAVQDNIEVCRFLRDKGVIAPVLALIGAESEIEDLSDAGIDDFLIKPFAMRELLAKVMTNTWHIGTNSVVATEPSKQIVLGRIVIFPDQVIALKDGEPLDLSQREFDLFLFLAKEPGRVFSREELLCDVWDYTGFIGDPRNVDVSIRRLREKIEDDPGNPAIILTRRGRGYFLSPDT